tara:strand:- start:738 stop:1529 length:792 start_codon:yes stop_codon:yes gene_type:complete
LKKDIHNKLIKYGQHKIADWVVIEVLGEKQKINEFLQGQLTSDINAISEYGFQLSSICDHKGFVICDFIIHRDVDIYKVIINNELKEIFIAELSQFAQFYSVKFHINQQNVIGHVKNTSQSSKSYWCNNEYCLELEIYDKDFNADNLIDENEWLLANKIAKILFLDIQDSKKYRPLEIYYDKLRVSFDKGCYRGQEIVARMKYLGVDRRKFSTLITKDTFNVDEGIKVVGNILNVKDYKIFNAIIKKNEIDLVSNLDSVIKII